LAGPWWVPDDLNFDVVDVGEEAHGVFYLEDEDWAGGAHGAGEGHVDDCDCGVCGFCFWFADFYVVD